MEKIHVFASFCVFLFIYDFFTDTSVEAVPYDYSATIECMVEPLKPQYGGGIITNPGFDEGLYGWSSNENSKIEERTSITGNKFIVSHSVNQSYNRFFQRLNLQKGLLYTFSCWVQSNKENVLVKVVVKTASGFTYAGTAFAESGCWSMLKGGFTANVSGASELYFLSWNPEPELWVDNVSLQPFTENQWRVQQDESIQRARKRKVQFHAMDANGNALAGAVVSIKQTRNRFPFGCAINKNIINNQAYQKWFTSRFTVTVFDNEMKWYSTERNPGKEDYSVTDAMVEFARRNRIAVRGHNILWDDPQYQPWWVKSLSPDQLKIAASKRIDSIVKRYAGKVIGWDVMNENLHFSFYEDRLGTDITASYFKRAHQIDPNGIMFMNDYNTIEEPEDPISTPVRYIKKLRTILSYPGNGGLTGIGLESHFKVPNIPYMRSAIDFLASAGLSIWLTEVDVQNDSNQAKNLEAILREAHSHPAVHGIVLWAGWYPKGCKMCLTDDNFKNLPTGNVVDKIIAEWKLAGKERITDKNGVYETLLFHGEYDVIITFPASNSSSLLQRLRVEEQVAEQEKTLHVVVRV